MRNRSPESIERLTAILARLQAGESGASIARSLGVTRQYIFTVKKKLEENGPEALLENPEPKRASKRPSKNHPKPPRSQPSYRLDTQEYERMSPQALEAMARSNQEVALRIKPTATPPAPPAPPPPVQLAPKLSRNSPCPLNPTKKFKRCCGASGATRCSQEAL